MPAIPLNFDDMKEDGHGTVWLITESLKLMRHTPLTSLLEQMGRTIELSYLALNSEEPELPPTTAVFLDDDPLQHTVPWRSSVAVRQNRIVQQPAEAPLGSLERCNIAAFTVNMCTSLYPPLAPERSVPSILVGHVGSSLQKPGRLVRSISVGPF